LLDSARTLTPWNQEWRIRGLDGRQIWVQSTAKPHRQANGDIVWDGLLVDISDRKQTELALQESEHRFRNVAENVPGAIFRYVERPDGTNQMIFMSPGCRDLW